MCNTDDLFGDLKICIFLKKVYILNITQDEKVLQFLNIWTSEEICISTERQKGGMNIFLFLIAFPSHVNIWSRPSS